MLRTALIGPGAFPFVQMLADWLSIRSNLTAAVWTDNTSWQSSWRTRAQFVKRRLKRYGLRKVFDEALFFAYHRAFMLRRDERDVQKLVVDRYWAPHAARQWMGDAVSTDDVNTPTVLKFLADHEPDVIFTVCILNYFRQEILAIPTHGVFLWHEGITPEYRGHYSPFWAIHNRDFENLGYTLLRMNAAIDGGEVFAQGRVCDVDYWRHGHGYIGHKAIYDSLPEVERLLTELERGTARPLNRSGAIPFSYTYPGLSDLIRQRVRLRSSRNGP